ncbi:MAG: nickel-dependent lactate racemase [Desulfovermiculus sp.]|nr:nickel-dependent lactate racemase [Desulfovermiculus sp.]
MHTELDYGEQQVPLDLPETVQVLEMQDCPPVSEPEKAVSNALDQPIASLPLRELARGKNSACIVISDITRPVPNHLLLLPLLETLEASGIPSENICILIATGMHRPNQGSELAALVGQEIMDKYSIRNHFCHNSDEMCCVDHIRGAPIEINKNYLDADLKILTGLIEPHFYAGYSGGRKAILPGISSFETMKFMHSYQVIDHPQVTNCVLDGNIFHQYGLHVAEKAGVDFIVNVCINRNREVSAIFAGHYDQAHLAGCDFIYRHAVMELEEPMDLVITSGGGYPLDATFYQISKALTCAKDIVKQGGTIVVACECREGLGSDDFCSIMRSCSHPEYFFTHYSDPKNFVIDQWCAQNIFQALDHAGEVYVYSSGLSERDVASFGARKITDLQEEVHRMLSHHNRVAVSPSGPYVVGRLV